MTLLDQTAATFLFGAHFDEAGVVAYRGAGVADAHVVYAVAQQALLGRFFPERCMEAAISVPYVEFVDPAMVAAPKDDAVARAAAAWLERSARRSGEGAVWENDFDFVYAAGEAPVAAPWYSAAGQAQAVLACLHWLKHGGGSPWKELARRGAIALAGSSDGWFHEVPGSPPPVPLGGHLLSLFALDRSASALDLPEARAGFERGWNAFRAAAARYDLGDWSRRDLHDALFLLLRLVPSAKGVVALGRVELATAGGEPLAELDATVGEAHDQPVSRLAGIDWGGVETVGDRPGRRVPNRQSAYPGGVPAGGTDQKTYLAFEERVPPERWIDSGARLRLEVFLGGGAELSLEYRDLRQENLAFRHDASAIRLRGEGWRLFDVPVAARLIGRPVPRHIHRFHVELLGALLDAHPDGRLIEVFERWHRADFFDVPYSTQPVSVPQTVFAFVNDRCGLKCRMCDVGVENLRPAKPQRPGGSLSVPVLRPSLSLNMTDRARDLEPAVLTGAIRRLGDEGRGVMLQLNGTEPLLYPHYAEILRTAKAAGLRTGITTSALFLPREAERLAGVELDQLLLSIDGPPEIHDEIRGSPRLFERIVRGVELLRAACGRQGTPMPEIVVSFAVTYDNHRAILPFLEAVRPLQPASVILNHLNFVAPQVAEAHNARHPDYPIGPSSVAAWEEAKRMDFVELFRQIEIALRTSWTRVAVIPYCPTPTRLAWYYTKPHLPMSRPCCAAPWASMQLRADGTVSVLARCFDRSMGDVRNATIQEIWRGETYRRFGEFVLSEPFLGPCLRCCGSL